MSSYRIPLLRTSLDVNGRHYFADGNGLFWPQTLEDAEEMEKLGAYRDAYPGAWEDLRFPAQGINPAGSAAPPSVDSTTVLGTLLFSGSQENIVAGVAQLPHAWERGSPIRPHIHWAKPTGSSNAVSWVLYYAHAGFAGENLGAYVGPIAGTIVAGDQTVNDQHLITSFGQIDMAGKKESSVLLWKLHRLGNTDADNNAVRLYEFDIHFIVGAGKTGTETEIPE